MDRKNLIVSIAAALVAVMGSPVSADLTYTFTDTIDFTSQDLQVNPYWSTGDSPGNGKMILEGQDFSYEHNINDLVDFAAGDLVTDADLTLDFHDDDPADQIKLKKGIIVDNEEEWVRVGFDGSSWVDIAGEVDTGLYSLVVDIGWLNDGGVLGVTVGVWNNPLRTGDVYLRSSTLSGTAVVPIPAAVLLGILGLGAAGWKLRKLV